MQWFLAILAALLLAAGVVWWMDRDTDRPPSRDGRHQADRDRHGAGDDFGPTLYRWTDDHGVENITDKPPKGRHYTVVSRDLNRVSLPHFESSGAATEKPGKQPKH
jgi:hypothetical protein